MKIVLLPDGGSREANDRLGKQKIDSGEIKGFLDFADDRTAGFPTAVYKSESSMDFDTANTLKQALQSIKTKLAVKDIGLTQEQLAAINSPVKLETIHLSQGATGGKTESQMITAYVLVYAMLFLLYVTVIGYGSVVATEITSEKNSRVMEVLISSVSPLKQMFGKIIGICLLGLIQIIIYMIVAAINISLPHNREMVRQLNLDPGNIPLALIGFFILFYLLGYLVYATVYAAVASLVSRTEEVNQAVMPVTFLIIAAFMIAMYGLRNPTAPFIVVMSYIPFFSPLTMFLRFGMSETPLWEVWLSIGILAASIYLLGYLAAKIYRVGVLMYGKRPSFKELRKAMKAFKV